MALTHLETHIDLSPASPKVITDSFTINCTDATARYKINADIPHAFLVRTAADITIQNASGTALTKDADFFLKQSKRDVYYSSAYSLSSIFSEIQFAEVGVYTVTRHLCVGTYINASFLNALKLQIKTWLEETIPAIQTLLSGHTTTLDTHGTAINQIVTNLSSEISARETLESECDAHAASTTAHGATSEATASAIMARDANGNVNVSAGTADTHAVTKKQMDDAIASAVVAAGSGDVVGPAASTVEDGDLCAFSGTAGKTIKNAGYKPGFTTIEMTSADVTLSASQAKYQGIIITGTLTANVNIIIPSTMRQYVFVNSTSGVFTVTVKTASSSGVLLTQGNTTVVLCNGSSLVKENETDASGNAVNANRLGGKAYASLFDASGNAVNANRLGGKAYASLFDASGNAVNAKTAETCTGNANTSTYTSYLSVTGGLNWGWRPICGTVGGNGGTVTVTVVARTNYQYSLVFYRLITTNTWKFTTMENSTQFTISDTQYVTSYYYMVIG